MPIGFATLFAGSSASIRGSSAHGRPSPGWPSMGSRIVHRPQRREGHLKDLPACIFSNSRHLLHATRPVLSRADEVDNLLQTRAGGTIMLADFGLAGASTQPCETQRGTLSGSYVGGGGGGRAFQVDSAKRAQHLRRYCSPESFTPPYDPQQADAWAAGVVAWVPCQVLFACFSLFPSCFFVA
jgi:serine/threonine protein kinase